MHSTLRFIPAITAALSIPSLGLAQSTRDLDERVAFEACVAFEVGMETGLTAADLDVSQQALDEAAYRQRMSAQLLQPGGTLICVDDEARTSHDALMAGEGLVASAAERRARQLRQMRRAGGFCAIAADEMEATGLGSTALGVDPDNARFLMLQQELLETADGLYPEADGGFAASVIASLVISGAFFALDRYLDDNAAQRRIDELGRQANRIGREVDRFNRDLDLIRELQSEVGDDQLMDAFATNSLRNGKEPELSDEARHAMERVKANSLEEAEDAVEASRNARAESKRRADDAVEAAVREHCDDDGSCRPNPEAICGGDEACLERFVESALAPARSRIGQCVEQIVLGGAGTTPAPGGDEAEVPVFEHVRPGMPACWVKQRRSACKEAGAIESESCGIEVEGGGSPLDTRVRLQIAEMHCSAEDTFCQMSQDIALGAPLDPMLMNAICARPLRLPESMETQNAHQVSAERMGEIGAACEVAQLGTIVRPGEGNPTEPNSTLGAATIGSVVIPPPFRPDPAAKCLVPSEIGDFYGNFLIIHSNGPICEVAASCAREIIAATDRVQARVDRRALLTGQRQEADRIAAACGTVDKVDWAVERLRSRLFFRPDFAGTATESEPAAPILPEPTLPELPNLNGVPDGPFEPTLPPSPLEGLPLAPPIPEALMSSELGAYVTFATSDGGIDAFRNAFCGEDFGAPIASPIGGTDIPDILSGPPPLSSDRD